jgi:hypothetical protein
MRAIVPAAIVFFIMATSLMARLFDAADDEAFRPIRKLSFGHDSAVMRIQAECAFIEVARLWLQEKKMPRRCGRGIVCCAGKLRW